MKKYNEYLFEIVTGYSIKFSLIRLIPSVAGRLLVAHFIVNILQKININKTPVYKILDVGCGPYAIMDRLVETVVKETKSLNVETVNLEYDKTSGNSVLVGGRKCIITSNNSKPSEISYVVGNITDDYDLVFSNPPFSSGTSGLSLPLERKSSNGPYGSVISLIGESRILDKHIGHWCIMIPQTKGLFQAIKGYLRGLSYMKIVDLHETHLNTSVKLLLWSTHQPCPI